MNSSALRLFLIFILSLALGLGFRLYPLFHHTKGNSEEKATVYVIAKTKEHIHEQVRKNYARLSPDEAKILEKKLFDKYFHEEGSKIRRQIDKLSKEISNQSKTGRAYPYLLASDSYYYLSLTKRILDKGTISDKIKGHKYFNELMMAPNGQWEPMNLHPFLGACFFKFLKIFSPSVDLMLAVSFLPLILTALSLIIFLFFFAEMRISAVAVFTGAVFFLLSPIHMKRSMFGWYDNDPYNILFPLLILYLLFLVFKQKTLARTLIFCGLLVATLGLYAYFWQGWIFMLVITLSSVALTSFIYFLYKQKADLQKSGCVFACIAGGSFLLASILFGPTALFSLFQEGLSALRGFLAPGLSIWPDLYLIVGELYQSEASLMIRQLGGFFFIGVSALGIIYSFVKFRKEDLYIPITLSLFSLASLLMGLGAQRFIFIMVVPFSLAFTFGIECILALSKKLYQKYLKTEILIKTAQTLTSVLLILLILIPVNWLRGSIRSLLNPFFNPVWEEALIEIKEKTPQNSIVTAWWPPGHFIKAMARRAVTFDGASINVPEAYWVANFFLAQSETEALGILRMLHSGGNRAVEEFESVGLDTPRSILAVKDIISRPKSEAFDLLLGVSKNRSRSEKIIGLTHSYPPPSYILVYNEFVKNNIQLKFIGNWNFQVINQLNKNPEELKKIPNPNSDEYIQFLWSSVGGPSKYSGALSLIGENKDEMVFQDNILIKKDSLISHVGSKKYGKGFPLSVFYLKDGEIVEQRNAGANLPYSIVLFEEAGHKNVILMDRSLANSLLMKLYIFDGAGLKYFKPFTSSRDLTGRTQIKVFEVDWPAFLTDFDQNYL